MSDFIITPSVVADPTPASLRQSYTRGSLLESEVPRNPFLLFRQWWEDAKKHETSGVEVNAMHVSTVTPDGRPDGRIVLMKGFDERGITFYTNYTSAKSTHLTHTPYVSITFYYPTLQRQIRIQGPATKTSPQESKEYFTSRPLESQIGAWASATQSAPVVVPEDKLKEEGGGGGGETPRGVLERTVKEVERRFLDGRRKEDVKCVERPEFWGGWRCMPEKFEFWQGRPARMHDRLVYQRQEVEEEEDGVALDLLKQEWTLTRLWP